MYSGQSAFLGEGTHCTCVNTQQELMLYHVLLHSMNGHGNEEPGIPDILNENTYC